MPDSIRPAESQSAISRLLDRLMGRKVLAEAGSPSPAPTQAPDTDISYVRKAAEEAGRRNDEMKRSGQPVVNAPASPTAPPIKKYAAGGLAMPDPNSRARQLGMPTPPPGRGPGPAPGMPPGGAQPMPPMGMPPHGMPPHGMPPAGQGMAPRGPMGAPMGPTMPPPPGGPPMGGPPPGAGPAGGPPGLAGGQPPGMARRPQFGHYGG